MHKELMKKLYQEYADFKQIEVQKDSEQVFQDAFQIAAYEMSLFHYERTLPGLSDIIFQIVCEKGLNTDLLLQETYKHTLLEVHPIMDEERFKAFLEDYFLV